MISSFPFVDATQMGMHFPRMSTLAEIENAADQLPPSQLEELVAYLMGKLQRTARKSAQPSLRSRQGFPVSRGRVPFGAAEVARIEAGE